jgi:hypothetical protein
MTKKVFALDTKPGIQRDGTIFDKAYYQDGRWVRFQRGRPRKMLGYREITAFLAGPSRGIYVNPQNAFTNIFSGYSDGLQKLPIDSTGAGSGISDFTLSDFTPSPLNLWQFDTFYDTTGGGNNLLLAHPGQNLQYIASTTNTPVLSGNINGLTMSKLGVFTDTATTVSGNTTITLGASNILIGAGQTVTGPGIPANTTVVSVSTTSVVISNAATASATVTVTFDNNLSVSGGVVSLHPYIFVYGNDGLIKNCSSGNANDWVSADANEVNVATGKIVQALPVRGGSNSPSGLFWSLDSLIRVSYAPTNITVGATTVTQFWRYDIITSQTSIMSSQCVIEYDGIYYWIGVDRFMLYNGVVKEIPNNMNQNYFFDNLNYSEREKIYATKVPRYGEVWWFYPRGSSTECNDAIVYNIRENVWYDAGTALGARRSAGYFSQVFRFPVNAGWEINATGGVNAITIAPGVGYTDGVYNNEALTGGSGAGAVATITVAGGVITDVSFGARGTGYQVGDVLTAAIPLGAGFTITVDSTMNYVSLWQHEFGTDAVRGAFSNAIESYFETNDLGWVSGGPSESSAIGENRWLRLERVEPDFVQSGEMELYITGRPYAQSDDQTSAAYVFDPDTNKIDMKEQRRELRVKFVSNVAGGNYQLGKVLFNADLGDVRGY